MRSRWAWLALIASTTGCGVIPGFGQDPIPTSAMRPGLEPRGGAFASTDDHLVELLVHEGHVYVANSNLGVAAMRLEDDGGLTLTDPGSDYDALRRCTSLAVHAPSDTLYCGSDSPSGDELGPRVALYDLANPGQPTWRGAFAVEEWATRDLVVVGDRLLIHHFDGGLWAADIGADGSLSQLRKTSVEGNARVSVVLDGRLVTLLADDAGSGAELRLLELDTFAEIDRMALDGPALGLSADIEGGARVGVGLGSGGMAIVAVEQDALVRERLLEPPGVVTTGLLAGDTAIAVTLSGAFAWSLDGPAPRMFGFGAAGRFGSARAGNMLHGVIHEGELIASDWLWVERWGIEPEGEVLELDVPRGIYLPPDGPLRWRMRNPGPVDLRAEVWNHDTRVWSGSVDAGQTVEVRLSAAQRASLLPADVPSNGLTVRVHDPEIPSEGAPVSSTLVMIVQRERDDVLPPALGDVFPTLVLEDLDHEVFTLPTPDGSDTVWFWPDCALIWPQLEDLAWFGREGRDLGRGTPIMLTPFDVPVDGFDVRWALTGAQFGMWGVAAPDVGDANDWLDDEDIYMPLFIPEMPGDAMPTDYVMDGGGVVRSIERMYRGPWTLVVPWPWD